MRRSRTSRSPLMLIIVLASIAFGVILTIDQMRPAASSLATPTVIPTATNTAVSLSAPPETPKYSLHIASLALTAPIIHVFVDGTSWNVENLGSNVGHLVGTAWFDDAAAGNIALVGHVELRDGTRGIFVDLSTLPIGDVITVHGGERIRRYLIESSYEAEPDDLGPLRVSPENLITLITCSDYDFLSNTYLNRHIVIARMVDPNE